MLFVFVFAGIICTFNQKVTGNNNNRRLIMTLLQAIQAVKKDETIRRTSDGFEICCPFTRSNEPEIRNGSKEMPNSRHHSNFTQTREFLGMINRYAIVPSGKVIVDDGQSPDRACLENRVYTWE